VVIYHCHPRLQGTWITTPRCGDGPASISSSSSPASSSRPSCSKPRDKPHYFRNFYGRRALRIWPVYVLVLVVVYLNAPWFIGPSVGSAIKTAPWLAYIFFVQNLFHLALPPAIGPTWSLAIEEQYYFVWAPLVRFLRRPWMLAAVLAARWSPRRCCAHHPWLTPTTR
jgi:peptidoglycan/LPS O-acetylase OafA/YrhL